METCSVTRRMSAPILLVTLSVMGMPLPAGAAGEERAAVAPRGLTLNGRPLSELAVLPTLSSDPPPRRRRVTAGELLGGEPVTESFDALTSILDPGYEVVVRDEAGRKPRGRLLSISGEEVVVSRRRIGLLWSPKKVMFAVDSIARVDIVDSTWDGIAIGAAAGVGVVLGVGAWES